MRTVAWAEPSTIVSSLADRHTTQVSADTQHDEPLWLLDTVSIRLWVTKCLPVKVLGLLDLVCSSVTDENWLTTPLDDNVLALGDRCEVDLNLGLSQDIGGCGHVH